MADPSVLVQSVLDLLDGHASLAGKVWDGDTNVADDTASLDSADPPWVQVSTDPGFRRDGSWSLQQETIEITVTTICVGSSARAARRVADWVDQALLNVVPSATGWTTHRIVRGIGRGAVEDVDIPTLWHVTPTWRVRAHAQETP